jgi:hypothetical protein
LLKLILKVLKSIISQFIRGHKKDNYEDLYYNLLLLNPVNLRHCKELEYKTLGVEVNKNITTSDRGRIENISAGYAMNLYYYLINSYLSQYLASRNIIELGAGYGFNSTTFDNRFNYKGGELCKSAIELGQRFGVNVKYFNYLEPETYNIIEKDSVVFTVHSIEQIRDARPIIENLAKHKDKIKYVVHFEPLYLQEAETILSKLRNKYNDLKQYNNNLLEVLKERNDIEILEIEYDIFGLNPLNPTNFIAWKFR